MTIDRIGGGFLLLVGLFVAWERRVLPLGSQSHPGPGYFPLVLAILLIILGGLLLLRGGLAPAFRTLKWGEGRHAAAILGCSLLAIKPLIIKKKDWRERLTEAEKNS